MAQNSKLVCNKFNVKNIPVLECYEANQITKPLVILCHGGFRNKEMWTEYGYLEDLAKEGYHVVALDSRLHGERKGITLNTSVKLSFGHINMPKILKAVTGTAEDVSALIDYYENRPLVLTSKTSMIGISMGGLITFKTLSKEKRIKTAVTIVSTNDWKTHPLGDEEIIKRVRKRKLKKAFEYADEYNTRQLVANYSPCAIMMHNGIKDKTVDIDKVKQAQQEMEQYYQSYPNKLKFYYYENLAHQYQEEEWKLIWQRTKEWLSINLKKQ
jgi:pimeloyl-ACP methyl ester carboxylesterase